MGSFAAAREKLGTSRRTAQIVALLAAFLLFSGSGKPGVVRVGEKPPDFSLKDLSGATVSLSGQKGNVVVLYFWSNCPACWQQLPQLQGVYARNRGKGLSLLAVNVGQERASVEIYARQAGLMFPVLVDEKRIVPNRYGVNRVPTIFLLDRQGIVREKVLGDIETKALEKMILAALGP